MDYTVAKLADGRQVRLYEDGTWQPIAVKSAESIGFRSIEWGASKALVKDVETCLIVNESANELLYSGSLAGVDAGIFYKFIDDQLNSGVYVVSGVEHYTPQSYVNHFMEVSSLLISKYGDPEYLSSWSNEKYRAQPQLWGKAMQQGHVEFSHEWLAGDAAITLSCKPFSGKGGVVLTYSSENWRETLLLNSDQEYLQYL